ncbi:MAG: DUF3332 family protein [Fibrobacteraceae bacterium]|nr:DUF3332 family protein [Fibrobacteraceae bacterium]MCF0217202.1 DUF3332 family protein [Fibrobacteraceae bacterium]
MKKGLLALTLAAMVTLTGCYGKNALFNKVHDFVGQIGGGNKWLASCINFLCWVIPVYEISLWLVDGLVLNTVEFWTGANPLAMGDSYYEKDAQGNQVTAVKNADGSLTMELQDAQGHKANLTLQRDENVVRALDQEGNLVAQYEIEK